MNVLVRGFALACVGLMLMAGTFREAYCGQTSSSASPAAASPSTDDVRAVLLKGLIERLKLANKNKGKPGSLTVEQVIGQGIPELMGAAADPSLLSFLRSEIQEWRTDVQTGSPSSSPGSTSLVSKGSVPSILGLAVENGALTQSVSGTSVTFRTNPTGLINALQKQGYAESGPESYKDPVIRFISKSSVALTFNTGSSTSATGQGGQTQNVFTGNASQISGLALRYDLYNHRDPRDPHYAVSWESLREGQLEALANRFREAVGRLKGVKPDDPSKRKRFDDWLAKVSAWADSADASAPDTDPNSMQSVVFKIVDDFGKTFYDDPDVKAAKDAAVQSLATYLKASGGIRSLISKSPILTLEYTYTRQNGAVPGTPLAMDSGNFPDLSTFKLIVAGGTVGGTTLTGNASLTLFDSNPQLPEKGRLRDFQLSGQADIPLGEIQNIGVPTLTFAASFLSLRQQPLGAPVEVNGVNVNLKGDMEFAQAKVSFPLKKGSGVSIPLSITYASRTEFNKEHDIRGSIGLTLNLDSIFAAAKP